MVAKDLGLADVTLADYLTSKYGSVVDAAKGTSPETIQKHQESLATLMARGQSIQYLGKGDWMVDKIEALSDGEVEKVNCHYEARLGAAMTKTLRQSAVVAYSKLAGRFLPISPESKPMLINHLEEDPFDGHAISSIMC